MNIDAWRFLFQFLPVALLPQPLNEPGAVVEHLLHKGADVLDDISDASQRKTALLFPDRVIVEVILYLQQQLFQGIDFAHQLFQRSLLSLDPLLADNVCVLHIPFGDFYLPAEQPGQKAG